MAIFLEEGADEKALDSLSEEQNWILNTCSLHAQF